MDLGIRQIHKTLAILCLAFLVPSLQAEQTVIQGYDDARDNYFYDRLYTDNIGESLYCGINRPISAIGKQPSLEHVMPADWMAEYFGCPNRDCDNPTYKHAEGDLHNLWLAVKNINSSRSDNLFGEIPEGQGESRFDYCPLFVRTYSPNAIVVEPRDSVKGNIARSLFYMRSVYGFDLKGMLPMLKRWNRFDPPGEHEHWRNERIHKLQGTRNKFIDNYHLGNSLE